MSFDQQKSRMLVLCFDGTANQYNSTNTNIVKFYSLLNKTKPKEQITYYQAGIGTYVNPGVVSPILNWGAKLLDEATAWCLDEHVRDGYRFLMQNYHSGDKISLFGFSRGAYTARALAGFLYKIGLLPKDNPEQVPFAYKLYKRTDPEGIMLAQGFKNTFCRPIVIDFVGVWDTVASVGVLYGRNLPFTGGSAGIKVFRHALSLDEHRARFQPNTYHRTAPPEEVDLENACSTCEDPPQLPSKKRSVFSKARAVFRASNYFRNKPKRKATLTVPPPVNEARESDFLEVWFAGCHSDVGGGSVKDSVTESLSDISLQWMIDQVVRSQCGILFSSKALYSANLSASPNPQHGVSNDSADFSRSAMESGAVHDMLRRSPCWWFLEFVPLKYSWQDTDGRWHTKWSLNLGKGRFIREDHPNFHSSVKRRMENDTLNYTPKARWAKGNETYID